jgi:hypothetical protein
VANIPDSPDAKLRSIEPTEDFYEEYELDSDFDPLRAELEADYADHQREQDEREFRDAHFARLRRYDTELANGTVRYPKHEHLVDGLFPTREVHVLTGESGVGKTSWLFDFIDDWQHERPVLGRASHWQPFCILVNDRSEAGMLRTLERLGKHPQAYKILTFKQDKATRASNVTLADKVRHVLDRNPKLRVVFIEGLQVEADESNDYGAMSRMMARLNALCRERNITIIATTHTSKNNAAAGGVRRTAIIGSAAMPAMCETVLVFTATANGGVLLTVQNQNGPKEEHPYHFDNGRLVPGEPVKFKQTLLTEFLENYGVGEEFPVKAAQEYFASKGKDRNAMNAALKKAQTDGFIERSQRGKYVVKKAPSGWDTVDLATTTA